MIGNHDMLLQESVLREAIPNIIQIKDSEGLGVYYTGDRKEIAIEHGHRYDVFSAPDAVTNKELCGNDNTIYRQVIFMQDMLQHGSWRDVLRSKKNYQ